MVFRVVVWKLQPLYYSTTVLLFSGTADPVSLLILLFLFWSGWHLQKSLSISHLKSYLFFVFVLQWWCEVDKLQFGSADRLSRVSCWTLIQFFVAVVSGTGVASGSEQNHHQHWHLELRVGSVHLEDLHLTVITESNICICVVLNLYCVFWIMCFIIFYSAALHNKWRMDRWIAIW